MCKEKKDNGGDARYVNVFLDAEEAMQNAEEAMHNCVEQLLNSAIKNPSLLCNNPRMKYLRDFARYAERHPGMFEKAKQDTAEVNCSSISTNSLASAKDKESPTNEKSEEEEDDDIERMKWCKEDDLIQKYFLSETLEHRQQEAQETMIANGIDPEDIYANKPACPLADPQSIFAFIMNKPVQKSAAAAKKYATGNSSKRKKSRGGDGWTSSQCNNSNSTTNGETTPAGDNNGGAITNKSNGKAKGSVRKDRSNDEDLRKAVAEYDALNRGKKNELSMRAIAKKWGVPQGTFWRYAHNDKTKRLPLGSKPGKKPLFTEEEFETAY